MIYLVHADGSLPNLALMRLSTWVRACGKSVRLVRRPEEYLPLSDPKPEITFGSSIFKFTADRRKKFDAALGYIIWGGTGVRVDSDLSQPFPTVDWDATSPDYSLYPEFGASIGFLTRGCRLRCGFCVVPEKEGKPRAVASVRELWRGEPHARRLHLLDNDAFAPSLRSHWNDAIREIREGDFRVCFSQGINLRLVDDEAAAAIASIRYCGHDFEKKRLFTAWDNLGDEAIFRRGVATLERAGIPASHLRVYMLIGYDPRETWETIFYRHQELVALGCEPFPMVYDRSRSDLRAFARWGGAARVPLYKVTPWPTYAIDGREDTRLTPEVRAVSAAAWERVIRGWKPVRLAVAS